MLFYRKLFLAYSGASMAMRKPGYDRKNQCKYKFKFNVTDLYLSFYLKFILFSHLHHSVPVSQVQVAAAASAVTGAPLHVATPMAPYISHYPQAHPQTFQAPYAHMVRKY